MAYEDDPYRDEDGEPLMNPDDFDREPSPEPLLDADEYEGNWRDRERSQTPVYDPDDAASKSRPRKRLVKKGGDGESRKVVLKEGEHWTDDKFHELVGDSDEEEEQSRVKRMKKEKRGLRLPGKAAMASEVEELWDRVGAGDSEDDNEGQRNLDDDNFIDDTGVHPSDRYGSDNDRSPIHHPQAEEGEENEIDQLFKVGKKKKKNERSPAEIAMVVENIMADLEVTAEEDAELNRQGKPAINKLKKVSLLTEVLSKKQLQLEFLDHGVLTLLKNWLEPLPDGSLPNINIRAAILKILSDYPLDLEQYDRREQLKQSGLGKVIMFLSKSDDETPSNRKLAKELVDKWSRPLFNKSTRFEDMRNVEEERPFRRPSVKKPASSGSGMESRDGDLDLDEFSRERKSGQSSSRQLTSRPEATQMDFVVRPQSKIDPDEVRARGKQAMQDQRRMKMNRKLQQLKAPKKKQLQATKLSVEGRGMVKYL
ncbi:protein IWS1 homolog 1 [Argentina anserina]|uniref:protein IWS1 homolog 1 n=1 Tax=Argentina anserina TaxID=57926 RepID=UPI0021761E82|nr:protein IWS1 homolog 1 [Potentilla anserina]